MESKGDRALRPQPDAGSTDTRNESLTNQVPLSKVHESCRTPVSLPPVKVHVIAHRGASGSHPDHTLESYRAAFLEGADWIEIDVQCTADGNLVVNHDVDLGGRTDVADWEWAAPLRRRTRAAPCLDGADDVVEGWMVCHLTLDQIKELRVRQPDACRSQEYNLLYEVPTFAETCEFVQKMVDYERSHMLGKEMTKTEWLEHRNRYVLRYGRCQPNPNVGLYIETKRPGWYRSIGLPLEEKLVDVVEASGFKGKIIIQSFETDSLRRMQDLKPEWRTVKLLTRREVDLAADENGGLDRLMEGLVFWGIDGIGPDKSAVLPNPMSPSSTSPIVEAAHSHGLLVHPYTFKSDVSHLHRIYGGNASQEFAQFFRLGVDGVFADFPGHAVFARELFNRLRLQGSDFLLYADMTNE